MAFSKIFWGFILMIDLRIGGFDMLPDFIGYILIYQGLGILEVQNGRYEKAKRVALPLIPISILGIYEKKIPMELFRFNFITMLLFIIGIVVFILDLIMVYNICMGISEQADELKNYELSELAVKRGNMYRTIQIALFLSTLFVVMLPVLIIPFVAGALVIYILMLSLINRAKNELEEV